MEQSRYITKPRASWSEITKPMEIGGLGIRSLMENLAFMAKLGWTILINSSKIWVRIFN